MDVEWRPFYLRPDTPPEGMELPDYIKRARANGSEERLLSLANAYGMEFKSTERIYNTRLAHEATEYAREHGKGNEFHKVIFRLVYAEGKDISQWDVLRLAAEEVGLNPDEMQSAVEGEKYKANVAEQVQWAYQIGVGGVLGKSVITHTLTGKYRTVRGAESAGDGIVL